jgi:hypothetical protein
MFVTFMCKKRAVQEACANLWCREKACGCLKPLLQKSAHPVEFAAELEYAAAKPD